jgi:hypothetical protein
MSLSRTTPTAIAEAAYEAGRARRFPLVNGVPDPRATWRPTVDPDLLSQMLQQMLDERLAFIRRDSDEIGRILLEDIDARFSPADMAVLARYGLTRRYDTAFVHDGASRGGARIRLPAERDLPLPARTGLQAATFTAPPIQPHEQEPQVPGPALAFFEKMNAARAAREADARAAPSFIAEFWREHKRQPTWRDVGKALPRLEAWMAEKRKAA